MTINIADQDYKIKQTVRAIFLWEQISEKPFEVKSTLDNYLYFYCILLANNPDKFTYSWDEFLDILDDDPRILYNFSYALTKEATLEKLLNPDKDKDMPEDKKKD